MSENTKTIKELCEEYSIGQSELSRMYGIPLRTVQQWHAGHRNPPPYVVRMLDELLAQSRPVFDFDLGDVVIDLNNGDRGEVYARCQSRYGLITYQIKTWPGSTKYEFRWVDQAHLRRP